MKMVMSSHDGPTTMAQYGPYLSERSRPIHGWPSTQYRTQATTSPEIVSCMMMRMAIISLSHRYRQSWKCLIGCLYRSESVGKKWWISDHAESKIKVTNFNARGATVQLLLNPLRPYLTKNSFCSCFDTFEFWLLIGWLVSIVYHCDKKFWGQFP